MSITIDKYPGDVTRSAIHKLDDEHLDCLPKWLVTAEHNGYLARKIVHSKQDANEWLPKLEEAVRNAK